MSSHSHEDTSERSMSATAPSSKGKRIIAQGPISSIDPVGAPASSPPTGTYRPQLVCPFSSCPLVFKGEEPYRYLKEHLKSEHEPLLAALVEGDKAEKEEKPRVNELELRAKSMEAVEVSVADRMAILEGMLAARKNGDNIKYDAGILLDAVARAYK